jgi:2-dehydropantoate 2-reductase
MAYGLASAMKFNYGIIGLGAIGLGLAHLLKAQNCTLFSRAQTSAAQMMPRLSVTDVNGETVNVNAQVISLDAVSQIHWQAIDLLILPVKCYQLDALVQQINPMLPPNLPVLLMQNGLGGHELLARAFPKNPRYVGATTDAIAKASAHRIEVHARGELIIGSVEQSKATPALAHLLNAHPKGQWDDHILIYLYKKLAVNAVINPLTAKFKCRNGDIRQHSDLVDGIKREVFGLYRALSLDIDLQQLSDYIDSVIVLTANNYSSMYQDAVHQRPTEIDGILGVLIKKAAGHNMTLPLIQSLYCDIKYA